MFIVLTAITAHAGAAATSSTNLGTLVTHDATPTEDCEKPEKDASRDFILDGENAKCQQKQIIPEREGDPSECDITESRCVPEFELHYGQGTSTDDNIDELGWYYSAEELEGWVFATGGLLEPGLFVFSRDGDAVDAALATGDPNYAEVAMQLLNLDTAGVRFAITDQGSHGVFLVVSDPTNEYAGAVPIGSLGLAHNFLYQP